MLIAGLMAGQLLQALSLPAALMIGPMLVGIVMVRANCTIQIPGVLHRMAQGIAGCLIASHLDAAMLARMGDIWPIVILFVTLTFAASCLVGWLSGRMTGIDSEVSIWGFLPGMSGTVIAIAHDQGLDSRLVGLIQTVRLMVVIATMVVAAMFIVGAAVPHIAPGPSPDSGSVAWVLGLAVLGMLAARRLRWLPSAASLLPLMVAAALRLEDINVAVPGWLLALAFLAFGAHIGLRMTPDILRAGARALPSLIGASFLLMALCAFSGAALSVIAQVDLMSALLATVPGSIDSIALIAVNANADLTFIMTLQTLRLFAVAVLGPVVARSMVQMLHRRKTT
ncbi:AbrB family transcriptional regulator [Pararhizobium polonicum]|uniref:AbrB family transcriptional regulator n=1 Tax=Pararhizobium polonicum TaxID=1612624 RepID=UPI001FCD31DC|nr:AbrB family transcriptional regulator [Pararhizobium polonicum]